eukprot:g47647.t1
MISTPLYQTTTMLTSGRSGPQRQSRTSMSRSTIAAIKEHTQEVHRDVMKWALGRLGTNDVKNDEFLLLPPDLHQHLIQEPEKATEFSLRYWQPSRYRCCDNWTKLICICVAGRPKKGKTVVMPVYMVTLHDGCCCFTIRMQTDKCMGSAYDCFTPTFTPPVWVTCVRMTSYKKNSVDFR